MKISVKTEKTVGDLIDLKHQQFLRINPEYQRGLSWTETQKKMFLDSIFRNYSISAFYLHKKEVVAAQHKNLYFDIVDGQQRINAIYSFSEGAYSLLNPSEDSGFKFPNFVKDEPCPWGGMRFNELPKELQDQLRKQHVVIYEITTDNENSIRDLFIRLQGGTPLTPQDKRDSWPGNFTEFVLRVGGKSRVNKWHGLPLFNEIVKTNNESRRRQLVAQIFMLFWTVRKEKKFCDIKSVSIDDFYHAHIDFDDKSTETRRFEKICRILYEQLRTGPKKVGHSLIHMFLLVDSMLDSYERGWESGLASNLAKFENRCRSAADDNKNRRETQNKRYYTEYGQLTRTGSDSANTIKRRHSFFADEMLNLLSPQKKDSKRQFTDTEREVVFFRDSETCQWCKMIGNDHRVLWDECDIHHVMPHAQGGLTEIKNAALVHRDCHPKKSSDVSEFRDWWSDSAGVVDL